MTIRLPADYPNQAEAVAIQRVRALLSAAGAGDMPDGIHQPFVTFRPERGLQAPYMVGSILARDFHQGGKLVSIDREVEVMLRRVAPHLRWRRGGVYEFDGLIWHNADPPLGPFLSAALFGGQHHYAIIFREL